MTARIVVAWIVAAVIGLALAAGITLAASQLSSQRIGLSGEPLSSGDQLVRARGPAPPQRARVQRCPAPRPAQPVDERSHSDETGSRRRRDSERGTPWRWQTGSPQDPTSSHRYPDRPRGRPALRRDPDPSSLGTVSGGSIDWTRGDTRTTVVSAGGLLFLGPLLMILFRGRYPGWWFDWNLNLLRFGTRVAAYIALLDDRYPSTEDEQAVHLTMPRPDVAAGDVSRGLPLVKWLLAIPHYIVLAFLWIGVVVAVVVAWFAILFTGRYPRGLFDFVVGVGRWHLRVSATPSRW